jgi:hypothetical protein
MTIRALYPVDPSPRIYVPRHRAGVPAQTPPAPLGGPQHRANRRPDAKSRVA